MLSQTGRFSPLRLGCGVPVFPDPTVLPEHAASVAGKREIRAALLAARRAIPSGVRAKADSALCSLLGALVRERRPSRIAGYVPMPGEPGGTELPSTLAASAAPGQLLLPVLCPDLDLDWAAYTDPAALTGTRQGVREAAGPRLGPDAVASAEVVVVPAVAVDRHGVRLGRGGGSYDRALARVGPDVLVVAVLYDGELVEQLPAVPHDRPVSAVVTPADGLCRFDRR
jgi:5-formyltetrahydrofolate cyclo-ligase